MKLQLLTAVAITALMAVPTLASANDQGWYVRGNMGYGVMTGTDFTGDLIGDVEGEGNGAVSLGLGYEFGNNWRLELDGGQIWNDLGGIQNAANSKADMRTSSLMMNAIYDFNDFGAWQPYIGAGIGISRNALSAQVHSFPSLGAPFSVANPACPTFDECIFDNDDTATAWQLLAGLGYKINDNLTWDTNYKYMNVGGLDYKGLGANIQFPATTLAGATDLAAHADGLGMHVLTTGLRYRFGGSAPAAVSAPTPTMVTCWDSSTATSYAMCPTQVTAPVATYTTCWDGTQVESGMACPVEVTTVTCWDGSVVNDAGSCAPQPELVTCWDGTYTYDRASCPVQDVRAELCANEYRQEIVYFNFNKGQSAETQEKLQRILDISQYCSVGNINVVGHTDSSGAASYNLALSKRRAADVRSELIRQGISGSSITSEGMGETQLFIDTGDGVKESLNRRVEVLIRLDQIGVIN